MRLDPTSPEFALVLAYWLVLTLCLTLFAGKALHWGALLVWYLMRPPCPRVVYRRARRKAHKA